MRLVSFSRNSGEHSFGRLQGDRVFDLGERTNSFLKDALGEGLTGEAGRSYALADVEIIPVIPNPGKILCANLRDSGNPFIFTRWADTLVGPGRSLVRPIGTNRFDCEASLAVVIGRGGRRIPREEALSHVAGYCCFTDVSVRRVERRTVQRTVAKNYPASSALGPCLLTKEGASGLADERIVVRVNRVVVSDEPVSDRLSAIPRVIEYCSSFTELETGDVITVGVSETSRTDIKISDLVEVEIGSIGKLKNGVIGESWSQMGRYA